MESSLSFICVGINQLIHLPTTLRWLLFFGTEIVYLAEVKSAEVNAICQNVSQAIMTQTGVNRFSDSHVGSHGNKKNIKYTKHTKVI